MTLSLKNIAVVGAGGKVGSPIVNELLKNEQFKVTAVLRSASRYTAPNSTVSTVTANFEDKQSLTDALRGQDAVVCCVPGGATAFEPMKLLIDASIAAGVKFFIPSEFVSDITTPEFDAFPKDVVGEKVRIRNYLVEKSQAGEIAFSAVNGGPIFDMWLLLGPAGFDIAGRKAKIYGTGNNPACWTPMDILASAVITILLNPEPTLNRGILIAGVKDVTQNALLEALEAELGEKFQVEYVDISGLQAEAEAALARGDTKAALRPMAMNANFNEKVSVSNFWDRTENEVVGIKVLSVREAVKRALEGFERK